MKSIPWMIPALLVLAGCASEGSYQTYVKAQQQANDDTRAAQKPLLKIQAIDGQAITGLASIEVNMPTGPAPVIQQEQQWAGWNTLNGAIGVAGSVGGIVAGGRAAANLATAVGNVANAPVQALAPVIQAPALIVPQANQTINGQVVIGSGSITTSANPTTVASGGSVIGSGKTNTLSGTGSTGAGGYTTNANPNTVTSTTTTTDNHSNQNNPVSTTTTPAK